MIMILFRAFLLTFALASTLGWCAAGEAQEPGKTSDEALDSLLEKIDKPAGADKSKESARTAKSVKLDQKTGGSPAKTKADTPTTAQPKKKAEKPGKAADSQKPGSGDVSSKDKELDELLEKLGQTKDEPAQEDRRRGPPGAGEPPEQPRPTRGGEKPTEKQKGKAPGLVGKDKELDERLEEFAGKKRKKNRRYQEDGSGPLGQIIKEMRDVEQRLGKPETGEDTQSKQKKIVKQIETLIEQMRQSGSSGSMAMRRVRQQGLKPGEQPGQTPGANARGAPATKPAKPSDRHALAGGKDVWGHLPAELRQEMDNVAKEEALSTKVELIRRYYLSVAKQKLVRGE
jgi:hypothetical protein